MAYTYRRKQTFKRKWSKATLKTKKKYCGKIVRLKPVSKPKVVYGLYMPMAVKRGFAAVQVNKNNPLRQVTAIFKQNDIQKMAKFVDKNALNGNDYGVYTSNSKDDGALFRLVNTALSTTAIVNLDV